MEYFTCDADDPDDPDAWMWSFSRTTNASRDATTKARQMVFFYLYLIPRFFVDNAFLTKTTTTIIPAPLPHVALASSSVSPSPFAVPSGESTSKHREETAHTATINTADKGNHAPLGREDEGDVDPAPRSDIETRTLLVPILIESRVQ